MPTSPMLQTKELLGQPTKKKRLETPSSHNIEEYEAAQTLLQLSNTILTLDKPKLAKKIEIKVIAPCVKLIDLKRNPYKNPEFSLSTSTAHAIAVFLINVLDAAKKIKTMVGIKEMCNTLLRTIQKPTVGESPFS